MALETQWFTFVGHRVYELLVTPERAASRIGCKKLLVEFHFTGWHERMHAVKRWRLFTSC